MKQSVSGVPQGSCLGPILFLLYINDSEHILKHSNSLLFADDCKLFLSSAVQNYSDLLQEDLYRIDDWFKNRQLKLSIEKCTVLYLGKRNAKVKYQLENKDFNISDCVKDLGLYMSNDLKASTHVRLSKKKCMNIINCLFRSFKFSKQNFVKCYKSLVYPYWNMQMKHL